MKSSCVPDTSKAGQPMNPAKNNVSVRRFGDSVLTYSAYSPAVKVDLHSHVVAHHGKTLLFDPIMPDKDLLAEIRGMGEPTCIFLTNGNHERACPELMEILGVPAAACAYAVPGFSFKPQIIIDGHRTLQGMEPIPVPGGGPGEYAYYYRPTATMIVGDALNNLPGRGLKVLDERYCMDRELLINSLKRLLDFPADTLLFSHGEPIASKVKMELERVLDAS
jgi:hypothetical protein